MAWISLAASVVAALDFVALMILLRLVTPAEYGIVWMAATLFPILDYATDLGLSAAVIQRDDHTPEKVSTVFWLNVLMSFLLFGLMFIVGPALARFQGHEVIGPMLIVYGTKLIFQNVYMIPTAMMKRELRFKELSVIRVVSNAGEFVGKIGFALAGFGVWAFVLGPMVRVVITGVGIQLAHPWLPRLVFRPREAADYVKFGLSTSLSQILFYVYNYVDNQIVGKIFGAEALGFYRAAYELILEPVRVMSGVTIEVAFPAFARLRYRRPQLVDQFVTFTRQNLIVVVPFLAVVFLEADVTLRVVMGPRFADAADAARILCLVGVLRALSFIIPPLLNGIGYPMLTLIYTGAATLILPALFIAFALVLGDSLGYRSVAVGWVVGYPIAFGVLLWLALSRIGLPFFAYLRRSVGIPICALAAMAITWPFSIAVNELKSLFQLIAVSAVYVLVFGLLLARFQGISPRSILGALRKQPTTPPAPVEPVDGPPAMP